jgi:hypothetical protein
MRQYLLPQPPRIDWVAGGRFRERWRFKDHLFQFLLRYEGTNTSARRFRGSLARTRI